MARLQTISKEEIQEMSSSLQSRVVTEVVAQASRKAGWNPPRYSSSPASICSSMTSRSWRRRWRELPKHKQHVLLLSLPNITLDINKRKKEALQANIWKMALLSGAMATVPIPGLSVAVDVSILVKGDHQLLPGF
ncbi:hypothetical protein ANANG_G00320160 [Anguilla anguilla]|uniref:Uncharacterized protein n=1 Tax=Anguilla anguilla TaxID=7936 RepID=A0A9D3RH18_ANGAN|nr:hypothetical protein ANANG_G00320160 [Anguilla anguilla]